MGFPIAIQTVCGYHILQDCLLNPLLSLLRVHEANVVLETILLQMIVKRRKQGLSLHGPAT